METELTYHQSDDETTTSEGSLHGKTCVVTGASRGIGRAIALTFGQEGADVVVNYRSSETEAATVADEIDTGETRSIAIQADVGDRTDVSTLADRVHDEFGQIDVLVNNAGMTIDRRFEQMTWEDWRRVIEVNLDGAFHCTNAFYDDLEAADHGRLINIASVIGQRGNYGQSNYAASKSALFGFTRSLALELAPTGTTANCVAPGYTLTDMVEGVRTDIKDRIRDDIPLDRFASTDEVASVVRFLTSEDASYVTGEVVNVNGGMYY